MLVLTLCTFFCGTLAAVISQVTIGNHTYTYEGLVGNGFWSASAMDRYGDTAGGWGSALAPDLTTWKQAKDGSYSGIIYALPDRGWNTNGIALLIQLTKEQRTIKFVSKSFKLF
jgi:hypothetical protein